MKRNWLIVLLVVGLVSALYVIELSKLKTDSVGSLPTLDHLQNDELTQNWDLFYKVRATIIDGQSANFSIPQPLIAKEGMEMSLLGAPVFFGSGCELINDSTVKIKSFFLLPTQGLANSCVLNPSEAMRWTIVVTLQMPWVISRNDMIKTEVVVKGVFKIDTSKPYEAAFYLNDASAKLKQ